jgi:hypothetical protein
MQVAMVMVAAGVQQLMVLAGVAAMAMVVVTAVVGEGNGQVLAITVFPQQLITRHQ